MQCAAANATVMLLGPYSLQTMGCWEAETAVAIGCRTCSDSKIRGSVARGSTASLWLQMQGVMTNAGTVVVVVVVRLRGKINRC